MEFRLVVEQVFYVGNRGTVVIGTSIDLPKKGPVMLTRGDEVFEYTITGIEPQSPHRLGRPIKVHIDVDHVEVGDILEQ